MKIPSNIEHAEAEICFKLGITAEELKRQREEAQRCIESAMDEMDKAGVHPLICHTSLSVAVNISAKVINLLRDEE